MCVYGCVRCVRVCVCVCVCVCVDTCMFVTVVFVGLAQFSVASSYYRQAWSFTHIAPIVQWGPSNTWKVDTKQCISHIMWHVQPSFELIVLFPNSILRCALLGKHDCVTQPLQAFVNTYVCVYWYATDKVPGSILLIC